MIVRPLSIAASLLCVPVLAGCFSYHRADGGARPAEALCADAWVRPDAEPLRGLAETPRVVPRYAVDRDALAASIPGATPERVAMAADAAVRHWAVEVLDCRLTDGGLIRLWHDPRNPPGHTSTPVIFDFDGRVEEFVRRGSFLTPDQHAWLLATEASRARHGLSDGPRFRGTPTPGVTGTDDAERWRLRDGYALGFSFPETEPAGLVVHLTSLFENKYEHAVVRRLRRWGWAVGHLETRLGVRGPLAEAAMDRRHEREAALEARMPLLGGGRTPPDDDLDAYIRETDVYAVRRRELGESLKKQLPDLGTGFEIGPGSDVGAVADAIARAADLRLSEHADAAAALVESLDAMRPDLAGRPIVVAGFSAGALAAPAVAARLREAHPGRPVFLVLAGGGGSLLDIARGSVLTNGGIRLHAPGRPEPTAEQIDTLTRRYEEQSRLDPLRVAAALRGVPVLHAYADGDTVVPTAAAERFNAAHGSVDRLVHRGNHDTLLFFLNSQASRVRSWLRAHGAE